MSHLVSLFLMFAALLRPFGTPDEETEGRNVLWNASFETGIGNGPWGIDTQKGPNIPELWYPEGWHGQHSARLLKSICSKRYDLGTTSATWRISFMARSLKPSGKIKLTLTNQNHHKQQKKNEYKIDYAVGQNWSGYYYDFVLTDIVRPLFHIQFKAKKKSDILIDAVMLYRVDSSAAAQLPFHANEELETGVLVSEITHVFLDGDEKKCNLIVANHSKTVQKSEIHYTVFDVRERAVRDSVLPVSVPPAQSIQIPVSLEDLPYSAYRVRTQIPGNVQAADGLIAILPTTKQDYGTRWGCNASLEAGSYRFSIRMMEKLGMGFVTSISTGQHLGRWRRVQRKPGKVELFTEIVDALLDHDIRLNLYLGAGRAPKWVFTENGLKKDDPDPEVYSNLFSEYVYDMVYAYAGNVTYFTLEDETSGIPIFKGKPNFYASLHEKAYDAAKRAARDREVEIQVSTNESYAKRFNRYWDALDGKGFDFISTNSIARPGEIASFLKNQQDRHSALTEMWVPAVGRRCQGRPLAISQSVSSARDKSAKKSQKKKKKGRRVFASYYTWEIVKALWMSRPFGNPDDVFGPVIHPGFYELRVMSNTPYLPYNAYSGIEFDNSPNPGFQSVVCMRFLLEDRAPWREPGVAGQQGIPLPDENKLELYPFRNDTDAVLVIMPRDGEDIKRALEITLPKGSGLVFDFFANRVPGVPDGQSETYRFSEFPVYVKASLDAAKSLMDEPDRIGISFTPNN